MRRPGKARSAGGARFVALSVFLILLGLAAPALGGGEIPPIPPQRHYILDKAGLLSNDAMSHIGDIQKRAAERHKTQIVVVTIERKSKYGGAGITIERFARKWFDEWGIGIRRAGKLYNRGILMLVSEGDRKARIELGAEWGHRWDGYCKRVMQDMMVPQFKKGDYSLGVVRGIDALEKMARRGPSATPPRQPVVERWLDEARRWTSRTSYFSGPVQLVMSLCGLALVVLSFFINDPKASRWSFWGGVALIVLALFTYIVVVVVGLLTKNETGGYSGGGGFGGGFSGGGGATGSW